MTDALALRAGKAFLWRAYQLVSVSVVSLLRVLVLARLLGPDEFGLLAIALVGIDFLMQLTELGIVPALVQRPTVDSRHYDTVWTTNVIRALFIALLMVAAAPVIAELFGEPRATPLIRAISVRPLLMELASIRLVAAIRGLNFKTPALLTSFSEVVNAGVAIAFARSLGVWALVLGTLSGAFAYLVTSYLARPYRPRFAFDKKVASALIRFGRWILLASLISMLAGSAVKVVIARQVGTPALGLYFLAGRLAFLPVQVAQEIIGVISFSLYSRLQENVTEVRTAFRAILLGLMAVLVPVTALVFSLAPLFAENVLGGKWQGTAPLIRALAVVGVIGLFGDLVVPILKGLGVPSRVVTLEVVQSTLLIVLVWWMAGDLGVLGACLAWIPAKAASQIIAARYLGRVLDRPLEGLAVPIMIVFAVSALGGILGAGVASLSSGVVGLVAAGASASGFMGALLWFADRQWRLGLSRGLARAFPREAAYLGLFRAVDGDD